MAEVKKGGSMKFSRTRKNVVVAPTTAVAHGISARFLRRLVHTMNEDMAERNSTHSSRLPAWPPHSAPILYGRGWDELE